MNDVLEIRADGQLTRIEAWGPDALRVRSTFGTFVTGDKPGALGPTSPSGTAVVEESSITNGRIRATVDPRGTITFLDFESGQEILREREQSLQSIPPRHLRPVAGSDLHKVTATFEAYDGERFYGLGQHRHGLLDQKGCVIDLVQENAEIAIPFLLSSRGYGVLWNNPGSGRVELGNNRTRWIADGAPELDYWIVRGETIGDVLGRYADLTGHAPAHPHWATGFWQSRLRYDNQQELMDVVHEHLGRGLPLSVIVIDFLHWKHHGDWSFDEERWPDPAGMVAELRELGVEVMVSVWPTVSEQSRNYATMRDNGFLLRSDQLSIGSRFVDAGADGPAFLHYYDPSNPEARRFVWEQVRSGYYDLGIRVFWLDACEPELVAPDPSQWRYHAGPGVAVAGLYPHWNAQAFHEGLIGAGETEGYLFSRSAWAGTAKYGTAIWAGDVDASFEALRAVLPAGLNAGLSGMPWWSADIGGFATRVGNEDPELRELIVRWFQFQVFTPLFRLHGHRRPDLPGELLRGAPNEVWSFGEQVYDAIVPVLHLRETLRPYLSTQMAASLPLMRPLFLDFPDQEESWEIADQFLCGTDLLAAPVLGYGARSRRVWLPADTKWVDPRTSAVHPGGQWLTVDVALDETCFFVREGSDLVETLR